MKANMLVIDHQNGTITVTKNGVSRFAPIKNPRTLPYLQELYREKRYFVKVIEKGTPPMALTPTQQAQVNSNHFRAIRMIQSGAESIHQNTRIAMISRNFINETLEILPAGQQFADEYAETHPDEAEAPLPAPGSRRGRPHAVIQKTESSPVITEQPVASVAADEARETILHLRRVALDLGKALAIERVPELRSLFEAIERSDQYLFK